MIAPVRKLRWRAAAVITASTERQADNGGASGRRAGFTVVTLTRHDSGAAEPLRVTSMGLALLEDPANAFQYARGAAPNADSGAWP